MGAPFFTPDDLAAQMEVDVATLNTAAANLFAQLASDIVRDDLHLQVDYVANDTVTVYGDSGQILVLPEEPVTAVTSVTVPGRTLAPAEYQWRPDGRIFRIIFAGTEYAAAQTWLWPFGVPVTVTYSHGYQTIPSIFKEIALELAQNAYLNPQLATSQTAGPFSISSEGGSPMSLDDEQKTRLDPYRRLDI